MALPQAEGSGDGGRHGRPSASIPQPLAASWTFPGWGRIPDCHPPSPLARSQQGFWFRGGIAEVAVIWDKSGLWAFLVGAFRVFGFFLCLFFLFYFINFGGFFLLNRSQGSSNRRCWNTATASGKIKAWSRHWVGKCPFCCWWGRDWEPDLKLSHRDAKRSALSHPGADISSDSLAFVTTLCPASSP